MAHHYNRRDRQASPSTERQRYCGACGKLAGGSSRFCPSCGVEFAPANTVAKRRGNSRRGRGVLKWLFIGFGVLILVSAIGSALGGDKEQSTNTAAVTTTKAAALAATAVPVGQVERLTTELFIVNTAPTGCHQEPNPDTAIMDERALGIVRTVDAKQTNADDSIWYRDRDMQCWTRAVPGPINVYDKFTPALEFAQSIRPTPEPTVPQLTPDPHQLVTSNLYQSYADNRRFMARASSDKLSIEVEGTTVKVGVWPSLLNEADALTVASQTGVAASKAFFDWYPTMQALQVFVSTELIDAYGAKSDALVAFLQINRATAAKFQYDGLKDRVSSDNKVLFCVADKYQIHLVVYSHVLAKGCLTGAVKQ